MTRSLAMFSQTNGITEELLERRGIALIGLFCIF
jgi:hypothetical protein